MAQLLSPCGLTLPAGHALQYLAPVVSSVPSRPPPRSAVLHHATLVRPLEDVPALGWYFPVWQDLQLLPFLYSPAAQVVGVQLLAPA